MIVWNFDKQNTSRGLIKKHGNLVVISVDRFQDRDNFLESPDPERLPQRQWVPKVVEQFGNHYYVLEASQSLLLDTYCEEEKEIYPTVPSFPQIQRRLERRYQEASLPRRKTPFNTLQWMATLLNRVRKLNAELGDNIDCNRGFDFEEVANISVIWELRGLSTSAREFFRMVKLLKLYHFVMARNG